MDKLEQLQRDDIGVLKSMDGTRLMWVRQVGGLQTLTVQNPVLDISTVIDELVAKKSYFIPEGANAYNASSFNCDAQFIRDKKTYSVYALQFYYVYPENR